MLPSIGRLCVQVHGLMGRGLKAIHKRPSKVIWYSRTWAADILPPLHRKAQQSAGEILLTQWSRNITSKLRNLCLPKCDWISDINVKQQSHCAAQPQALYNTSSLVIHGQSFSLWKGQRSNISAQHTHSSTFLTHPSYNNSGQKIKPITERGNQTCALHAESTDQRKEIHPTKESREDKIMNARGNH